MIETSDLRWKKAYMPMRSRVLRNVIAPFSPELLNASSPI